MAATHPSPRYSTRFDPQSGEAVAIGPGLTRVTAPNASPYTFTGTNSFLIGDDQIAIIDPGPDDTGHLAALERAIAGRKVAAILLTHTHRDHSALAPRLARLTGAPLWFGGPHRPSRSRGLFELNPFARAGHAGLVPDRTLRDGEILRIDSMDMEVVATPGHCANHLAFAVLGTSYLLSGDHVMGWSSTLVGAPDGELDAYLKSLDKIAARPETQYLPAHGGPIPEGPTHARALKAHRLMRNTQILQAVAEGITDLNTLARHIYPDLEPPVLVAARQTLIAHLDYLAEQGKVRTVRAPWGLFIKPL